MEILALRHQIQCAAEIAWGACSSELGGPALLDLLLVRLALCARHRQTGDCDLPASQGIPATRGSCGRPFPGDVGAANRDDPGRTLALTSACGLSTSVHFCGAEAEQADRRDSLCCGSSEGPSVRCEGEVLARVQWPNHQHGPSRQCPQSCRSMPACRSATDVTGALTPLTAISLLAADWRWERRPKISRSSRAHVRRRVARPGVLFESRGRPLEALRLESLSLLLAWIALHILTPVSAKGRRRKCCLPHFRTSIKWSLSERAEP